MLADKLKKYNIILASNSPRRQHFFKELGLPFQIRTADIEEVYPPELKGSDIADYLAKLKSKAFTNLKEQDLLITSDTIVWHKGKALGKPKNEQKAFEMLKSLSNDTHQVITSICLRTTSYQGVFNDVTTVVFDSLSDEEINFYIKNYQPYDKAGAYGIQEWIGYIGIKHIDGSYFNVVGLPVHKLYKELMAL